jgi:multicomponent Na+:H+ antiporter subunit C
MGAKTGGNIPILDKEQALAGAVHAADVVNPLPHVLMLTAIVVSVGVTGVALAVALRIYKEYGSIDEDQILERIGKQ